ncbi:MAG TPA: hypothetical protein VH328_08490 [Burkholderiaceae bacterium]|jgi:hypothetical protein|nr:hypothetical protein [Burkholderiaceae bacterium]
MPCRLLLLLLAAWAVRAGAQAQPCDDVTYARDTRVRYPQQVDAAMADEAGRRAAWNARADAISARIVAARATTADAQSTFQLGLWRRPDIASLDTQIAAAETDYRERNVALVGAPVIARLDPLRPDRAACLLAEGALQTLRHRIDLETEEWRRVDSGLLDEAARLGVPLGN